MITCDESQSIHHPIMRSHDAQASCLQWTASPHLKSLYGLLMQKIAAGGIEGLQVLCSLLHAVEVQAELAAGAQAEPGQAQRGGQRDADAGRADSQRRQVAQLVPCGQPGSPQLQPRTSKDAAWRIQAWALDSLVHWFVWFQTSDAVVCMIDRVSERPAPTLGGCPASARALQSPNA